jgi:pimeloyl-ACP methyl ester carboxylesterase
MAMAEVRTSCITAPDGVHLAVHRMGTGRPLILLHGLFSDAEVNWVKYGTAARLAAAGFECLMPDLRGHGQSDAPHDPAAWPADVLVSDLAAVVSALGLADYDLCGFSLGARTSARGVLAGLTPRRLVLGGMGLEGLAGWSRRGDFFIRTIDGYGTFKPGTPEYTAQQFLKSMNTDRVAARLLLQSVEDTPGADVADISVPTLVVCGADDHDNGSGQALADALPDGIFVQVPGTHMSSVTQRQLGDAIADFLTV